MPKKSGNPEREIRAWLEKVKFAEKVRNDADARFGYTRSLKEYAGDYASTIPSFMADTPIIPINEVYGFAKAFVPSVYSRNPRVSFNPRGKDSIAASKVLESAVNAYWNELRLKRQVRRTIFDAIFAEGWMKTGFSSAFGSIEATEKVDGEEPPPVEADEYIRNKEIFSVRVSWQNMVRDPDAVDGIHDARFVAQKIVKPLDAILGSKLYTAKDIRATHSFTPNDDNGLSLGSSGRRHDEDAYREDYCEFWEVWDADTQKIYWVSAGCDEYLREPEKWPYRFNGYPFDLLRFNQLEDECYAPNLIGPWEPQLWEKIKIRSMQMDHVKRFNRQLWAEEGTVSKTEMQKFALGRTGAVNFYKGKTPPVPTPYPQLQTDIYAIENRIDMDKDNISGQPNAVRGAQQKTQSRTLGEIKNMVSAFEARQLDPQGDVEDFCGEIACKIAAVAQDYLPGEKFVRVSKQDLGTIVKAFGKERYDGTGFKFNRKDIENAEFDYEVKVGSTLPLDRNGRTQSMIDILKLGPAIGLTPGDRVSKVIGKQMLGNFEAVEIEVAYDEMLAQMEREKVLMQAEQRMQQEALEDKISQAKSRMMSGQQPGGMPR
jgi:hypothetical protein